MADLFPESLRPEAIGFQVLTVLAPHFFALYPDDEAESRLRVVLSELEHMHPGNRWNRRPPGIPHLTIAEWGKPRGIHEPYEEALLKAKGRFFCPAFDVTFVNTASFANGTALVLEVDAASADACHRLRIALADAQRPFGLIGARARFKPHLTLAYGGIFLNNPSRSHR
jgi:2'-5' RNA ligase